MSCFRVVFDVLDFMDMIIGFISYVRIQNESIEHIPPHVLTTLLLICSRYMQILEFSYTLHKDCVSLYGARCYPSYSMRPYTTLKTLPKHVVIRVCYFWSHRVIIWMNTHYGFSFVWHLHHTYQRHTG